MSISGDPCKVEVRMACVPRSISILHPQDMLHPAGWAPLITEILQKLAEIDFDFLVASFGPRLAATCGNRVQLKTSADSTLRAPPKTTHSTCLVNTSESNSSRGTWPSICRQTTRSFAATSCHGRSGDWPASCARRCATSFRSFAWLMARASSHC